MARYQFGSMLLQALENQRRMDLENRRLEQEVRYRDDSLTLQREGFDFQKTEAGVAQRWRQSESDRNETFRREQAVESAKQFSEQNKRLKEQNEAQVNFYGRQLDAMNPEISLDTLPEDMFGGGFNRAGLDPDGDGKIRMNQLNLLKHIQDMRKVSVAEKKQEAGMSLSGEILGERLERPADELQDTDSFLGSLIYGLGGARSGRSGSELYKLSNKKSQIQSNLKSIETSIGTAENIVGMIGKAKTESLPMSNDTRAEAGLQIERLKALLSGLQEDPVGLTGSKTKAKSLRQRALNAIELLLSTSRPRDEILERQQEMLYRKYQIEEGR
jgi:hypothetical protein